MTTDQNALAATNTSYQPTKHFSKHPVISLTIRNPQATAQNILAAN